MMTNEEAITIIHKEYQCVNRDCGIEKNCGRCDLVMPSKEPILQAYKMAIKALEQEPKWIPVSERLPNLDDYTGSKVWQKKVLITGYLSFDDTKDLFVSEAFVKDVICNQIHDTVVTAWMPLPKPYEP